MKEFKKITLEKYFRTLIGRMEKANRFSTARNYTKTMESFMGFLKNDRLLVSDLSQDVVARYNEHLKERHVTRNTLSFYNRILRAVYNKAVQDGYAPAYGPCLFDEVYTGVDRTRKRSVSKKILRQIAGLDLHDNPEMELSRDLFLFSFFARGMCFVDLAYLTWKEVSNGSLEYIRSKTDQRMEVRIEPCMAAIMEKWKKDASLNFVFPIVRAENSKEAFEEYQYRLCRHNLMLKEIGRRVNVPFPLNSYVARHSWASLARDSGVSLSVISSGMGHTTERTTRIYLSELDNKIIDHANRRVISLILE